MFCRKCGNKMRKLITMEKTNVRQYYCPDCKFRMEDKETSSKLYAIEKDK